MQDYFILDEQIENISNKNSEECIREAIACFNNGNYRASVAVLYTAIIFDLLQKVIELSEIYHDKSASSIIENIKKSQKQNPKSPEWEATLIEEIQKKTHLITPYEKDTLLQIKQERNYAAHPIISFDSDDNSVKLKSITKETAKDLIRKAFEIVFLKDTILAKNIINDIIRDANNYYDKIGKDGLKEFLETKYFKYITQYRKEKLFKDLWKLVFILDDENCNKNRQSNYYTFLALFDNSHDQFCELIRKDSTLFFGKLEIENFCSWVQKHNLNINETCVLYFKKNSRIHFLIQFIEEYPGFYRELNDYAKNILEKSAYHMYTDLDVLTNKSFNLEENKRFLFYEQIKLNSELVFLTQNPSQHFNSILTMINNYMKNSSSRFVSVHYYSIFNIDELDKLFKISEKLGYEFHFKKFLLNYCLNAQTFYQTDFLFEILMRYVILFEKEDFFKILAGMEENSQYYDNKNKTIYLEKICSLYKEKYSEELLISDEEKFIYNNLTKSDAFYQKKDDFNTQKALDIFEQRVCTFSQWNISNILSAIMRSEHSRKLSAEDYPNIFSSVDSHCKNIYFNG